MARCFAVAISHAPGPSGTPRTGHCSSAITRASCASSSAAPTSSVILARPAIRRGDSIRQTASIADLVASCPDSLIFRSFRRRTAAGVHHLQDVGGARPACPVVAVQLDEPGGPFDGLFL